MVKGTHTCGKSTPNRPLAVHYNIYTIIQQNGNQSSGQYNAMPSYIHTGYNAMPSYWIGKARHARSMNEKKQTDYVSVTKKQENRQEKNRNQVTN